MKPLRYAKTPAQTTFFFRCSFFPRNNVYLSLLNDKRHMRKILAILLLMVWFTGCHSDRNDPKQVAWGFLHAYYTNDYEGALQYADSATYAELSQALEQLLSDGFTTEEIKASAQPVIIEVEGIIANDGYRAVCAYKLKNSPDVYNAMMETLLLNKTDDGWKVAF